MSRRLQVARNITPEDFDSPLLSLEVTATAEPLGSTETLQQTMVLPLSLAQNPMVSVELTLANISTIEAAGMPQEHCEDWQRGTANLTIANGGLKPLRATHILPDLPVCFHNCREGTASAISGVQQVGTLIQHRGRLHL